MNAIREDFLQARRTGIGGSDIGAIIGVSPFKSAVDVFLAKTEPNPTEEKNELFYWGHALEAPISDRFALEHSVDVIRDVPIARHPRYEWMVANVDGIINDFTRGILEIKTVSAFGGRDWGADGSDEVPLSYVAQCAWYMAVMDYDYAILAALFGGNQYREFRIERDADLETILIDKGREFWFNHVQTGIAPEATTESDALRLFRRDNGNSIECGDDVFAQYQMLKQAKEHAKHLDGEIGLLETKIKIAMGEAATLNYHGQTLATWKSQSANRMDTKALEAAHPEIASKFRKVSESRVLRLK